MTNSSASIDIVSASVSEVYKIEDVKDSFEGLGEEGSRALKSLYRKMLIQGGYRFCVKPTNIGKIDDLVESMPNFSEPLEDIRGQMSLCANTSDSVKIMPMLLLGDPGVGKTHFARKIADFIGTSYTYIGMGSSTAGWILSGSSAQWKDARAGKVFHSLVDGDFSNPVIVVDEIDKASQSAQYDPMGALYALLEKDTASEFVDEFADVPIDASNVIWIATANDSRNIPEPILSRMNVYEIKRPDDSASRIIAQSIYKSLINENEWGNKFCVELDDEVLDVMVSISPRDMGKILIKCLGLASIRGSIAISADDVAKYVPAKKRSIGF